MLTWSLACFIAAVVAAVFGFGGIVEPYGGISRVMFFVFLVGYIVFLILALTRKPWRTSL